MIRFDRLEKLADHLERGKLGHGMFFFGVFSVPDASGEGVNLPYEGYCGSAGCALGELPFIAPDEWELRDDGFGQAVPLLKGVVDDGVDGCASEYFGVEREMVDHLFYPNMQLNELFGGDPLGRVATKEEVAANIRAFIKKMRGEA